MARQSEADFLVSLIRGETDPLALEVLARVTVMRARFAGRGDSVWDALISDAQVACTVAVDRAYLQGLLDGTEALLSEDTFPRLEPMFTKYAEGSDMFVLLENAAEAFSTAVQAAATMAMARFAIDEARRGDCWGDI